LSHAFARIIKTKPPGIAAKLLQTIICFNLGKVWTPKTFRIDQEANTTRRCPNPVRALTKEASSPMANTISSGVYIPAQDK